MKVISVPVLIIFGFLIESKLCESPDTRQPSLFCTDLNPQNSLDLEQIMGMWYGSEILTHHDSEEGTFYYDSCVVIHLADITTQISTTTEHPHRDYSSYSRNTENNHYNNNNSRYSRYLRLIWDEMGSNLEYTLRYNTSRQGFWISSGPQKGTMLDMQYNQFSGTVQVMKAVGNHLVLTFCNNRPGSQLFTVVLARQPNTLTYEDIQSIRSLLKRRGLSTAAVRKVCTSGASLVAIHSLFFVVVAFLINQIV